MLLHQILPHLDALAPLRFAESWDNVGLLTGDPRAEVRRILLTVDATPAVFAEAEAAAADLLVSYHPLLIAPTHRLAPTDSLYRATRLGLAVYSPHTAMDAAVGGTNDTLADMAGLASPAPLVAWQPQDGAAHAAAPAAQRAGQGRVGTLEDPEGTPLAALASRLKAAAQLGHVRYAEAPSAGEKIVRRIACAAGAGDSLVPHARRAGADVLVTGELRHHTLLACMAAGLSVVLLGHDGSERPALARLERALAARLGGVVLSCSQADGSRLQTA